MTRKTKVIAIGAILAALGIAGAVAAHDGRMGGPGARGIDIVALDTDGDGAVSRAEMTAGRLARLGAADSNGDGRLGRDELAAALPLRPAPMDRPDPDRAAAMAERMIARFGDGESGELVIATMVERQVEAMFSRLDTDTDDRITAAEIEAQSARHAALGGRDGHGPRGHGARHD